MDCEELRLVGNQRLLREDCQQSVVFVTATGMHRHGSWLGYSNQLISFINQSDLPKDWRFVAMSSVEKLITVSDDIGLRGRRIVDQDIGVLDGVPPVNGIKSTEL